MRAGLNYVDTSPFYGEGKSEEVLGRIVDNDIEDVHDLDELDDLDDLDYLDYLDGARKEDHDGDDLDGDHIGGD